MITNLYIEDFFNLFDDIQKQQIFEDQKTMVDAVPKMEMHIINQKYNDEKINADFNLKEFIQENFSFNEDAPDCKITENLPIEEHINELWGILKRTAKDNNSSLIALPKPYIVPGGRFNEFFYWDSYFVMLGLQVSGEKEMAKNIVDNCKYLIETVGFVPNGNRTYFLSRTQPPFFSLMVELLAKILEDDYVFQEYAAAMEKEYQFWMKGEDDLQSKNPNRRVFRLENAVLNRYFDNKNEPRPESYLIDIESQKSSKNPQFYSDIRSACESGWDFSSRWFKKPNDISTINTQNIVPVDLNCLLWHLESTLAKVFKNKNTEKHSFYKVKSEERKSTIQSKFWNEKNGVFSDYRIDELQVSDAVTIATIFPLYFSLATEEQAEKVAESISKIFLQNGGLITTNLNSGQQWDSPNAWAPFQWMGYVAMKNYGFNDLAEKIKNNWCRNVERVYENTGKLMEKYNAIDTTENAGGGEYPNQDGFGWTNGVYLKLKNNNL